MTREEILAAKARAEAAVDEWAHDGAARPAAWVCRDDVPALADLALRQMEEIERLKIEDARLADGARRLAEIAMGRYTVENHEAAVAERIAALSADLSQLAGILDHVQRALGGERDRLPLAAEGLKAERDALAARVAELEADAKTIRQELSHQIAVIGRQRDTAEARLLDAEAIAARRACRCSQPTPGPDHEYGCPIAISLEIRKLRLSAPEPR